MYKKRYAWAEINLAALEHNVKAIQEKVGNGAKIIGVVKADAYGHGSVECSKVLKKCGVDRFAVATVEEAIELREAGLEDPILILGHVPSMSMEYIIEHKLSIVVSDCDFAREISEIAEAKGTMVRCMIAVDTGMGRIGFCAYNHEEIEKSVGEISRIDELPGIEIIGAFSHFSTSDEEQREYTRLQLERFNELYERMAASGINIEFRTIANSAAITEYPCTHFDAVRPGIILYGCYPSSVIDETHIELEPVMSVKACIAYIKDVPTGTAISYGRKFVAERPSRIATITLGYADGYSRRLSGNVEVLVRGHRVPVVGNICMDQCMVDVTDVPDAELFDEVVVMGRSGDEEITADELAAKLGTINYEITCCFGLRLPKVYVK